MTKKEKQRILEKVHKYFSECSSYEMWRDFLILFERFQSEVNSYQSHWDEKESSEEYEQVLEVYKATSELAELLKKYSELHSKPKETPYREIQVFNHMKL